MSSRKQIEDRLYHYTDYQALNGIIVQGQLRINNILNMNDGQEMRFFMNALCREVSLRLIEDGNEELADNVETLFARELKKEFQYSSYAACFSRYRDDAAQWERYGSRGKGVCIAFDRVLLEKMTGSNGIVSLREVSYNDDVSGHELTDRFYGIICGDDSKGPLQPRLKEAFIDAWIASAAYKHPSFACENEVRLMVSPFNQPVPGVQPGYHITTDRIKKYYPLDLQRMCLSAGIGLEDLIREIIIGPESTQSLPILQDYFHDHELHQIAERISVSDCPLRRSI